MFVSPDVDAVVWCQPHPVALGDTERVEELLELLDGHVHADSVRRVDVGLHVHVVVLLGQCAHSGVGVLREHLDVVEALDVRRDVQCQCHPAHVGHDLVDHRRRVHRPVREECDAGYVVGDR